MRILFDQGAPVPLRSALVAHDVETAWHRGWSELSNGDLLTAAEAAGFDLLIANWPMLQPHATNIAAIAASMQPGGYREWLMP